MNATTRRVYTYAVIAEYACGRYAQGQLISRHTSYELARAAARRLGDHFTALRELRRDGAGRVVLV